MKQKDKNVNFLYKLFRDLFPCDITIDSRQINNNGFFFALKGERTDGHLHIKEAFDNGARYAIISERQFSINSNCLLVESVMETLVDLAKLHRQSLKAKVLGITGSTGKTTTKELVFEILKCKYRTHKTIANYNTIIGLSISLLKAPIYTEFVILEMGARKVNDISDLCNIAKPTHGVILNVQESHLESLKNLEGVLKVKTELYNYLSQSNGIVFINTNNEVLKGYIDNLPFLDKKIEYSESNIKIINQTPFIEYQCFGEKIIKTNIIGEFQKNNIAAAYSIGQNFDVDEEDIHLAISNYIPSNNRVQIIESGNKIILLDAYNANIHSIKGVLEAFKFFKQKTIILGAMQELGGYSKKIHKELGFFLSEYFLTNYCSILLLGNEMCITHSICKNSKLFHNKVELIRFLMDNKNYSEMAYLIKGSRYWELETLVDLILD